MEVETDASLLMHQIKYSCVGARASTKWPCSNKSCKLIDDMIINLPETEKSVSYSNAIVYE